MIAGLLCDCLSYVQAVAVGVCLLVVAIAVASLIARWPG